MILNNMSITSIGGKKEEKESKENKEISKEKKDLIKELEKI